ncbi:MAG: helicase C-terminal domain-containing protein [Clostridium sp.]|nr:helicase C-terminal domain-containing protein [Clostridium sp.]
MKPYSVLDNIVFLQIETTGSDLEKDKITKINAVKIKKKEVTKFNGENAVEFQEFAEKFPLICYDASFEKSFLKINSDFLDFIELAAILFPELPEFSLEYLAKKFEVPKDEGNSSEIEKLIMALNYIVGSFLCEYGYSLPMSFTELEKWKWYKYIERVNMDDAKCFAPHKKIVMDIKEREPYPIFGLKDYEKLFENEKIWRRNGRSYTLRPQQEKASRFIREGLEKEKVTIMEAPTGLGKSMAYLLPAVIYAHLKNEKVIISTNTKGLQNQLVQKDIPNLLEQLNLERDIKYTLIKGKSNYLCLDRFHEIKYPKDKEIFIGYFYLKRLITEKGLGDIEEINSAIREKFHLNELIEKCFCDLDLCDTEKCKYRETCYYAQKVESLKESQIIVINHSLLLRWSYQPIVKLENIIIDEAHNLTNEAYDAFEETLVSSEFKKFVYEIYNSREKNSYLYYLSKKAKDADLPLNAIEIDIKKCIEETDKIKDTFKEYAMNSGIKMDYNIKGHLNATNEAVLENFKILKEDLEKLNKNLDKSVIALKNISSMEKDKRVGVVAQKVEIINGYIGLLEDVLAEKKEGFCFYFELDRNFLWWKVSSIPLDVSGAFYEKVLQKAKSCTFISATLSSDNGYNNLKNTLGINISKSNDKEIVEVQPITPVFEYKKRSAVYPMENFDPNNIKAFSKHMKDFVLKLLDNVDGNIIMLFTSKKRLTAFKACALEKLKSYNIRVVEGKKNIQKLKRRDERYIFLGSKGFFEGVDIPGDAVTTVVLDKLPNVNSKEPFYKSLIDQLAEKGIDYWKAYAIVNFPIVSIDLKQIYGRLIRTEYDYGSLFIMSKFDRNNSTVKKLERQIYEVPIVRKNIYELAFKDLNVRRVMWKQMNLYKIMKESKVKLKEAILKKKLKSIEEKEVFINEFMCLEYQKRKLKYDAHISLENGLKLYIKDKRLNLGRYSGNIEQYFKDILNL